MIPESEDPAAEAPPGRPLRSGVAAWFYSGRHRAGGPLRRLFAPSAVAWSMLTGPTHHDYQG